VNCIVFSRDRAMQLDAFLDRVERYARDLFARLVVIYTSTSTQFEEAYARLELDRPWARWVREEDFRDDLLRAIDAAETTVFHTDDDVYYRPPGSIGLRDDEVCFTLRLGVNTTYCYPLDLDERLLEPSFDGDRVSWDWRRQGPGAYRYPLALNGHVFRTWAVESWLKRASYANPNELEAALQTCNDEVEPRMASFRESVVVSIPANIVNETYANRHGNLATAAELNDRFLAGQRIDLATMRFDDIRACHQEIPFAFREA
jgi:hypothetical protein